MLDLSELLYPIGLFKQRASTLIRFSQQYLALRWPIDSATPSTPIPAEFVEQELGLRGPDHYDVNVFHGVGRYASDSFRIYSPLLKGGGAPEKEDRWFSKRRRAMERLRDSRGSDDKSAIRDIDPSIVRLSLDVQELGEYLTDEEDEGEEEWRKVRATGQ